MASQNQNGFYSQPVQYNNYQAYADNHYPGPSGQPNLPAYQTAQAMDSLPQAFFDQLTLSRSGDIGALGQGPTLSSVYTESQYGTGSDSDAMFAVYNENMHHDDDVVMAGQQPEQESEPKLDISESGKEEDDSSWNGDDQFNDVYGFITTKASHLQRLDNSWILWDSYRESNGLFDEDGNHVEVIVKATTGKEYGEETVNDHRHHVMYRRNYFKVEGRYWLTPAGKTTGLLYVKLGGNMVPVEEICATVRGVVEGNMTNEIEICTFDAGRNRLNQGPLTLSLAPSNNESVFEESTAVNEPNKLGTWLRMQWRKATDHNGTRRAKRSSTFNIVMRLKVRVRARDLGRQQRGAESSPGTELVDIGYCMSGPIQARGRCPQSFEEYDPTNVNHKRRRPNNPNSKRLHKGLLGSKLDSKTRIGKDKKQSTRQTRPYRRRATVPRALTPSTGQTSFSRSPSRNTTQTTESSSLPHGRAPTAPMSEFGAARAEVDNPSNDEIGNFQREVLDEFGIAGELRYQHPAATPMWPSQTQAPPSRGNLLEGISAWTSPSESELPDTIPDSDLHFYLN